MKNINVVFRYGHFWDEKSGERILLNERSEILLAGDDQCFTEIDYKNTPLVPLDSASKLKHLIESQEPSKYRKILDTGEFIFFKISPPEKNPEIIRKFYVFKVKLLEDLYLYHKSNWKDQKNGGFFDCKCIVQEEIKRKLDFFEIIHATSLNNAYQKTFMFYFSNQGSPTANAFSAIYLDEHLRNPIKELRRF